MDSRVAIIAGAGRFPLYVAQEAKRQGMTVVALAVKGWADASLAASVDAYEDIAIGQLGRLIERLRCHQVRQVIMAGKVTKEVLVSRGASFDLEALALLGRAKDFSAAALLGAVGERLEREGITLLDSSAFLKASLCPAGVLTARGPTAEERDDIDAGLRVARTLASLDVGQTVVVKQRVVVAVEALEGTDAAIRRAHALAGEGLVVVKTAAPNQDRRFDLPIVGTDTMVTLSESGVSCLALEAGLTLLLEREALITKADDAKICVVGVAPAAS